jgi:predicted HNH restriction endonuclease
MVNLNEDLTDTDNGTIREYLRTMDDVRRMLAETDWNFESVTNDDALAVLEDMTKSDKGITKLSKIIQSAKNLRNCIEDANSELDNIYELISDWDNFKL